MAIHIRWGFPMIHDAINNAFYKDTWELTYENGSNEKAEGPGRATHVTYMTPSMTTYKDADPRYISPNTLYRWICA